MPWELSQPEFLLYDLWTIFNIISVSKFLSDVFWEKGLGGLVALRSLLTLKKGTKTSYYQSNEHLMNFKLRALPYEVAVYGI